MSPTNFRAPSVAHVRIDDAFWSPRLEVNRTRTLDHVYKELEATGCFRNFDIVAGKYLAAAYNCGSKRVEQSRKACTDGWTCLLPEETKIYLKKFDVVWRMRQTLDR